MKKYYIIILCLIFVACITSCATHLQESAAPAVTAYGAVYAEALN